VFRGTADVDGARGHQSNERMLVNRKLSLVAGITREIAAEPVRSHHGKQFDGFAIKALREGGTSESRVVRDDEGEAGVIGPGPEGSFAKPRMADHRNPSGVNFGDASL